MLENSVTARWQVIRHLGRALASLHIMWAPPDEFRLASKEEIIITRASIHALEDERTSLDTTITNNQTRHDSIASQLASLQDALSQVESENEILKERIKNLVDEINKKKAWIAPQRTLPKEMLGEIFVAHVKLDWKAPLVDSSVCKRWRSVALSTPRLWSFLRIPNPSIPPELTTIWLKRAVNAPLHVHITYQDVSRELLLLYQDVYCMKFKPWPTYLHGMTFYRLEKLILDHDDASMDHLARGVFTSFARLRILHLHWFRLSRRPLLQWAWDLPPLEEFHIAGASWVWIDAVELVAPSLKRLAIDMGDVAAPPPSSIPVRTLHLPNLTYFAYGAQSRTLMMDDSARVPIVRMVLDAPNVETFEDHTVVPLEAPLTPGENWCFPGLKTYVGRTSRELGELRILFPRVRSVTFVVDSETGVLDVAELVNAATEGQLDSLEEVEMYWGKPLDGHPLVVQAVKNFEETRGRKLAMKYHSGRDETPYQQCFFGFPCCGTYEIAN